MSSREKLLGVSQSLGLVPPSHGYTIAEPTSDGEPNPEVVTAPGVYFPIKKGKVIPLKPRQTGGEVDPKQDQAAVNNVLSGIPDTSGNAVVSPAVTVGDIQNDEAAKNALLDRIPDRSGASANLAPVSLSPVATAPETYYQAHPAENADYFRSMTQRPTLETPAPVAVSPSVNPISAITGGKAPTEGDLLWQRKGGGLSLMPRQTANTLLVPRKDGGKTSPDPNEGLTEEEKRLRDIGRQKFSAVEPIPVQGMMQEAEAGRRAGLVAAAANAKANAPILSTLKDQSAFEPETSPISAPMTKETVKTTKPLSESAQPVSMSVPREQIDAPLEPPKETSLVKNLREPITTFAENSGEPLQFRPEPRPLALTPDVRAAAQSTYSGKFKVGEGEWMDVPEDYGQGKGPSLIKGTTGSLTTTPGPSVGAPEKTFNVKIGGKEYSLPASTLVEMGKNPEAYRTGTYYEAHPEEKAMDEAAQRNKPLMDSFRTLSDQVRMRAQGYGLGVNPNVARLAQVEAAKELPQLAQEEEKLIALNETMPEKYYSQDARVLSAQARAEARAAAKDRFGYGNNVGIYDKTTGQVVTPGVSVPKARTRQEGDKKIFEESGDGGKTWTKVSEGPVWNPRQTTKMTIKVDENGNLVRVPIEGEPGPVVLGGQPLRQRAKELSVSDQRELDREAFGRFSKLLPKEADVEVLKRKNLDELLENIPNEQQQQVKDIRDRATELKQQDRTLTWNQALNKAEKELGKLEKILPPIPKSIFDAITNKYKSVPNGPAKRKLMEEAAKKEGYDPSKMEGQ